MFDISPEKLVVFLVIALVVLGPGRLSEAARALGRLRAQLRQLTSALPPETVKVIRDPRSALLDAIAEPRQTIADAADAVRQSVITAPAHEQEPAHEHESDREQAEATR
jgi:Sec-independent protein translocase protein TatA